MGSIPADAMAGEVVLVGTAKARPFRNVWMLEELQIPYTLLPSLPRSSDVLMLNPAGKVPILKHGDFTMTESAAINTYLGDTFRSAANLVPKDGQLRGRYEELVQCIVTELDAQGLWIHRKHEAMKQFFGHIPEYSSSATCAGAFCNTLNILLARLREAGDYLLGNFSAADILLVHCLDWATVIQWLPSDAINAELKPVLEAYLQRCHQRDAYQRAILQRKAKL
eukprot:s1780_g11.t1